MKRILVTAALAAFALAPIACNQSPEGGAPGTEDSFKLVGGAIPAMIKPGDAESVKITIDRGKNFHRSVRLETKAPDAVAANLDRNLVKEGESPDVNVRLRPKEETAPGDYKVQVTATPDDGSPTTLELTVKVIAK